jgi:hypothetical protein
MPRLLKHIVALFVLLIVAGCAGGGCGSGCSGCAGVEPLPAGFEPKARIENAGSVRLTSSGMSFLQQNLGTLAGTLISGGAMGGVITFPVPPTSGSQFGIQYNICKNGAKPDGNPPECLAEIDIGKSAITIQTATPRNIVIGGTLPIRVQSVPIDIVYGFFPDSTTMVLNGNQACPNNPQTFADIGLDISISIEIDAIQDHIRYGYSKVKIEKLGVNQDHLKNAIDFCGGGFSDFVLTNLKGIVFNLLYDQLIGTLKGTVEEQLCQAANAEVSPSCPPGTNDVGGTCRYGTKDTDECVSILLGTDGHMNLGQLFSSISPGTRGGLDFVFAAGGSNLRDDNSSFSWGDLNPINGGATLGMYGGAEAMPVNGCVPFANIALPKGIGIPEDLLNNTLPDWPAGLDGPHVGIGVSERFTNYFLASAYNGGMFCIGISTATVDLLNSGTLGLIANSLKDLGLQQETQQLGIVVRPQTPPQVKFGNGSDQETDPLLRVAMKEAAFDFYIWSTDRFIRFMTATFDLDVPVNLVVTPDGLQPVITKLGVANGKVTNSALLQENPETLAVTLQDLIGGLVGQAIGGGISPIDINSSLEGLGLTLTIPETVEGKGSPGLRRLTKNSDNYLGIFATLALANPMPVAAMNQSDTSVEVTRKDVTAEGVRLTTMTRENAPLVRIHMASTLDDGSKPIEFAYRVDNGLWHPFTRERFIDIDDPWIRIQGRHTVHVWSRVAGEPASLDPTPATVEVLIDVDAPSIKIGREEQGKVALTVTDFVSDDDDKVWVRTRLDGGAWSGWSKVSESKLVDVGEAAEIDVEARDEEGNIATASQAIIRGGSIPGAEGCGCVVVGGEQSTSGYGWLAALGAVVGVALRLGRRSRKSESKSPAAPAAVTTSVRTTSTPSSITSLRLAKSAARALGSFTALALITSWAGCSCGEDQQLGDTYTCAAPDCITLEPGLIGAYTSAAVAGATIWVAGYAEADWNNAYSWGDLAVGKWSGDHVAWGLVDGVPTEPPPDTVHYNGKGFRGGQTDAGEDVGLWTSIAIDPSGNPAVAYYDRTNKGLKFAQLGDGSWKVSSVQRKEQSDIGKYAKLQFVNGAPVIAYFYLEQGGENGALKSGVRVARAASANPGEGDWTFEDVSIDTATPCRASFCGTGTKCIAATGLCTATLPSDACPAKCASGTACIDQAGTPACAELIGNSLLDSYPAAVGLYVATAIDPKGELGIAYYDRLRGNVVIASKAGAVWNNKIVDGEANGVDSGDMGIGTTLAIDPSGDWHLAYVDGHEEVVRYLRVAQGTTPSAPELVDNGLGIEGDTFADGHHIVGDDANILVTPSGEVHITYQDATAGTLRHAVGSVSGDKHTWNVQAIDQKERFAGAFSRLITANEKLYLMNWWRVGGKHPDGVKGDVTIITP